MTFAYHFGDGQLGLAADRIRVRDGRPIETGSVFTIEGLPVLHRRGLHGSVRAIDALRYAKGTIVSRTRHSGIVVRGDDRIASTVREHLWVFDAAGPLLKFACRYRARMPKSGLTYAEPGYDAWDAGMAAAYAAADAAWVPRWDAHHTAAWDDAEDAAWKSERTKQEQCLLDLIRLGLNG